MDEFWTDSKYFTGPPLQDEMVRETEALLGYRLPASYVALLRSRNGGTPVRDCFPTSVPTSWAKDHVALSGIRGIGGEWGMSIIAFLGIFFVAANITKQVRTRRPTFIEIDVSNATLGVSRTSNIEDQRSFNIQETVAYFFVFKRPVVPGHIICLDPLRNAPPKIQKQYVTSRAACIFLTDVAPECAFRLTFNKSLEV